MSDTVSFVQAGLNNLQTVCTLVREFYDHFADLEFDTAATAGAIADLLTDPRLGRIYLIQSSDTGEYAGYIALTYGFSIEFRGRFAFIDEFYLRPTVRGRGWGKAALAFVEQACTQEGLRVLFLEVDVENPDARRLYVRARFAPREHYDLLYKRLGSNVTGESGRRPG